MSDDKDNIGSAHSEDVIYDGEDFFSLSTLPPLGDDTLTNTISVNAGQGVMLTSGGGSWDVLSLDDDHIRTTVVSTIEELNIRGTIGRGKIANPKRCYE